jgi:predicted GNAT family acetyltransferase
MTGITVHRESDVVAFARRVMPFMMQREVQHNIMLGLFAVMQARPLSLTPYLAWAERDAEVVGVAMQTRPFRLLLGHGSDQAVIEALARDRYADEPALAGVMSGKADAAAFADIWQQLSGQSWFIGRRERLYQLARVNPLPPVAGHMRAAEDSDLDLVTDWWLAFAAEAVEAVAREQAQQQILTRYGIDPLVGGLRLWEFDGTPVSLAGYTGPTPNSIRIGPVYTPPEQRGHGYASALVAALSQDLLDKGFRFVTLFTDLANSTSNHIYQAIGYTPVADIDEIHFAPPESAPAGQDRA